jgi:hypothetical protein
MIPESCPEHTVLVVYDLRDPDQFKSARADIEAWGGKLTTTYALDCDHIVVAFDPGGGARAAA